MPVICEKPLIETLGIDEQHDRLDTAYYLPEFVQAEKSLEQSPYEMTTLGEVMTDDASYGVLPPSSSYCDKGIVLLRSSNISNDGIDYDSAVQVPHEWISSQRARLKKNDILISIKGARAFFDMCVVQDEPPEAIVNGSIFRFQCKDTYDPNYVVYWLLGKQIQSLVYRERANLGISYINSSSLSSIPIPVVDIETQKEILNAVRESLGLLEGIDRGIMANRNEQDNFAEQMSRQLRNVLDLPVLEKPYEQKVFVVPTAQQTDRLDVKGNQSAYFKLRKTFNKNPKFKDIFSVASDISNGLPERDYCDDDLVGARRYLLVADIKNGSISDLSPSFISNKENKVTLSEKTLLFTRKGTVGEVATPKESQLEYVPSYEIICVDLSDLDIAQIELIRLFFISKYGRLQVYFSCSGGQMPSISQERFKELYIPLLAPTDCLDINAALKRFISKIEQLQQISDELVTRKKNLHGLFLNDLLLSGPEIAIDNLSTAIKEALQ